MFRSLSRPAFNIKLSQSSQKTFTRTIFGDLRFRYKNHPSFHYPELAAEDKEFYEEPLPETFAEKYQLYEPSRWIPLTAGIWAFLSVTGIYQWDADTQIALNTIAFITLAYANVGPVIWKAYEEAAQEEMQQMKDKDQERIDILNEVLAEKSKYFNYEADMTTLVNARKKLEQDLTKAVPLSFEHRRSDFIRNKLDRIVKIEADSKTSLQKILVDKATSSVTESFKTDKALQESSLKHSLSWLQAEQDKKPEYRDVGAEFMKFFEAEKKNPTVSKQIEAEMKANIDKVLAERIELVDEYAALRAGI